MWVCLTNILTDTDKNFRGELSWLMDESCVISSPALDSQKLRSVLSPSAVKTLEEICKCETLQDFLNKFPEWNGPEWFMKAGILTHFLDGLVEIDGHLDWFPLLRVDFRDTLRDLNKNPGGIGL